MRAVAPFFESDRHSSMARRLLSLPVFLVVIAAALALTFLFWHTALEWTWARLGFAWIPALLWPLSFALVLRYRTLWIGVYWRDWVGAAFFSLGAIGLLSLFTLDQWWLEDATLAGHWGTILGGEPLSQKSLGILKVVVLFAVVPPIISPRLAGGMYMKGARNAFLCAAGRFSVAAGHRPSRHGPSSSKTPQSPPRLAQAESGKAQLAPPHLRRPRRRACPH